MRAGAKIRPFPALAVASLWCIALLFVRLHSLGSLGYPWLVWNLTLAWLPFLLALGLVACRRRGRPARELIGLGVVWLLFLPNAPYVVTDFIHLGPDHRLFDGAVIGSFAATSLALGLASVVIVQGIVTRARGTLAGWSVTAASLVASSIGVYLGRVQRLNSWDVLTEPRRLWRLATAGLEDPLAHRHVLLFVAGLAVFLTLAYLMIYAVTSRFGRAASS